jgi:hypothetical protein
MAAPASRVEPVPSPGRGGAPMDESEQRGTSPKFRTQATRRRTPRPFAVESEILNPQAQIGAVKDPKTGRRHNFKRRG